ncbi:MAG: DUF4129 domain-containing protein, partial [Planctomycetaceae bacterium]|nr:DUF4129 domain-containing protein [Planctomycetaceae bacterium]
RLARRLGFDRRPAETLSAFSARLRRGAGDRAIASSALADWYDEYVRVRYGAQEAVAHADELAARLRAIRASARRR